MVKCNHLVADTLAPSLVQGKPSETLDARARRYADFWVYGVLITDGEGRVRLINPAAVRLLDTDMETALYFSLPAVQE